RQYGPLAVQIRLYTQSEPERFRGRFESGRSVCSCVDRVHCSGPSHRQAVICCAGLATPMA
ncbi:hypothetical protein MR657_10560, partial [bacterium]|nr:hypothetical protein [bacterium]